MWLVLDPDLVDWVPKSALQWDLSPTYLMLATKSSQTMRLDKSSQWLSATMMSGMMASPRTSKTPWASLVKCTSYDGLIGCVGQLCVSNIAKETNTLMGCGGGGQDGWLIVSSMSSALNFAMHCKRANLDENRKQFLWCAKCFQCYPGGVWLNIVRVFFYQL